MASAKAKMLKQLSVVYLTRRRTTNTLTGALDTDAAAEDTSFDGTFSVPGTTTDLALVVGEGEECELVMTDDSTGANSTTITLAANKVPLKAHLAGEKVYAHDVYDLGDVDENGVQASSNAETVDVTVSTRRLLLATLNGFVQQSVELAIPAVTPGTMAIALGIPFARVRETGSTPNKWVQLITDGSEWLSEIDQCIVAQAVTMDGSVIREEHSGLDADPSNLNMTFGRGVVTKTPLRFSAAGASEISTLANPFSNGPILLTQRPGKGKLIDRIDEVGVLTPVASKYFTASANGTADQSSLTIAAGGGGAALTDFAAGDWFIAQSGSANLETAEAHKWATYTTGTGAGTIRDQFYRDISSYAYIQRATLVPFGGVTRDGVQFNGAAQSEPLYILTSRSQTGVRPGNTNASLSFQVANFDLTQLAQALGIDPSAIVNSRLPVHGGTLGALSAINCVYFRGVYVDGTSFWLIVSGCSNIVNNVVRTYRSTGQISFPITIRPSSCIQVYNIV